jgi:RimJ/RimL family protein N-acetyltransferase
MPDTTLATLKIRPGRAEDLPLVKDICADVGGGRDYVPYVWNEWAADPQSQLYLFELEGQPAAIYCLRLGFAGPDSSWVQGVRVATAFQKRGLAAAIIEHAIVTTQNLKLNVVRYSTAEYNTPMHRLAERYGFHLTGKYMGALLTKSPTVEANLAYRPVSITELDEAYRMITASDEYQASEGFYCVAWCWRPLSREVLREHIEKGQVLKPEGVFTALAIVSEGEDEASYWLSFLAGEPADQEALLTGIITRLAGQATPGQKFIIDALLPQTTWIETLLQKTGFTSYEDDPVMCLYELVLSS